MSWRVTRITDRGPEAFYRFHVEGLNTEAVPPAEFSWSVPSVADPRFVPGRDPTVAKALDEAKAARPEGWPFHRR